MTCSWIQSGVYPAIVGGQAALFNVAYDAIAGVESGIAAVNNLSTALGQVNTSVDFSHSESLGNPFVTQPEPSISDPSFSKDNNDYTAGIVIPTYGATAKHPGDFTKSAPVLSYGSKPGDLTATAPGDAPAIGDHKFPADPTAKIPPVPILTPITIPAFPIIEFPEWTATAPGPYVEDEFGVFNWTDPGYTETVRTEVVDQITAILGGSTGIPDNVWDMIEERARKQLRASSRQATEEALEYWAGKGHFLSNGALRKRVKEAKDLEREGVSDLVRELVIQDSKIYVERLNNALAQGIALETQLIGLYNAQAERDFIAYKTVFDIGLQVANYKLEAYKTRMEAYRIEAIVFQTRIQAEVLKLEEVKVKLEAQKLVSQVNLQTLEAYKTQVIAITATYDLFKTQVDAVAVKYEAEKTKILAYAEEVNAYKAQVDAWSAEWQGYGESVKAEVAKITGFEAEASAYNSRIQGYASNVTADRDRVSALVDIEQLKIDRMKVSVDKLGEDVRAESARVEASLKTQDLNVDVFKVKTDAERTRVDADLQRYRMSLEKSNYTMQAQINEANLGIQKAKAVLDSQVAGLNAILQSNSQLASSAMAALNYAMTLGEDWKNASTCTDYYAHES